MNSKVRLSLVTIALVKLDEIFAKVDPDTRYERARALYDSSIGQISEDNTYLDWVNHVRADLPFCSLSLTEELMVYRMMCCVVDCNFGTVTASIEIERGRLYPSFFSQDLLPGEKFPIPLEILNDLPE